MRCEDRVQPRTLRWIFGPSNGLNGDASLQDGGPFDRAAPWLYGHGVQGEAVMGLST